MLPEMRGGSDAASLSFVLTCAQGRGFRTENAISNYKSRGFSCFCVDFPVGTPRTRSY